MNTHEELTREHAVRGSSDRAFGIMFSVFFALAGLASLLKQRPIRSAFVLACLLLAVTILRPAWLHPLNLGWTKLGLLLGRIVNPIVMGLLFFVVVAPTALIFRLLGKDPLRLSLEATAGSYWIDRRPPGPSPQTMANQF